MNLRETGMSYRRSAIEGASPIGLIIVLFDTLAGDLRRAVAAIQNSDIETRCKEMNHADLVIARLESWIDRENGGESAEALSRWYSYLREKIVEAATTKSAKLLEAQTEMILQVRSAWQLLDAPILQSPESSNENLGAETSSVCGLPAKTNSDNIPFSQSA